MFSKLAPLAFSLVLLPTVLLANEPKYSGSNVPYDSWRAKVVVLGYNPEYKSANMDNSDWHVTLKQANISPEDRTTIIRAVRDARKYGHLFFENNGQGYVRFQHEEKIIQGFDIYQFRTVLKLAGVPDEKISQSTSFDTYEDALRLRDSRKDPSQIMAWQLKGEESADGSPSTHMDLIILDDIPKLMGAIITSNPEHQKGLQQTGPAKSQTQPSQSDAKSFYE